jgi:hypothetical protein
METFPLTDLSELAIRAESAEVVTWQGRQALRLENGLALIRGQWVADASLQVCIGTDGPAYPGLAFRVADLLNFELAYAVPHTSGLWDALQYDPVFHGSNTWQVYHGLAYQRVARVPTGRWFEFRVDFAGQRAAVSVDGQPPLVVEQLAHSPEAGLLGLWTYLPATFCDLRLSSGEGLDIPLGERPGTAPDVVQAWFAEGFGVVRCEPNGVLNLNRYLSVSPGRVRLGRRFELSRAGTVSLSFGFSDALSLELDGQEVFAGEHKFAGFADRAARGYAELGMYSLQRELPPGPHHLVAALGVSEPFGWGLALSAQGEGLRWLPAEMG